LAGIALFVVAFGRDLFTFSNEDAGHSIIGWVGELSAREVFAMIMGGILTAAVVLEGWLLLHLLRQNGRLLLRVDALEGNEGAANPDLLESSLPIGSSAPPFTLSGLHGDTMTLDALRATGKPVLLFFMDPGCNPCNAMLPEVGQWQREHAGTMTIAIVSRGSVEDNRAKFTEHGIVNVLLQRDREVAEAYQMPGTPTAILIDPDGTISSPLAFGQDEIEALVERSMSFLAEADGSSDDVVGEEDAITPAESREPIPDVALPDLSGRTLRFTDLRGRPTVVLFWNPDCGFCKHMLPDLKAWEIEPPADAPQLVVVSMGTVEENREMGLTSPVVLDQDFSTGRAFGVSGTPTAVMIDAEGRRASGEVMGASAVLDLLGETSQARVPVAG
jgi:thiol-disulfide isomerase/thioredoxin